MFSPTTMASSTTIPNTKIKVKRESIFIDTSTIGINIKPPRKEIGIPKETQPARFVLRKRARTIITKARPNRPFSVNRSILA